MKKLNRVVITGMGTFNRISQNVEQMYRNIIINRCNVDDLNLHQLNKVIQLDQSNPYRPDTYLKSTIEEALEKARVSPNLLNSYSSAWILGTALGSKVSQDCEKKHFDLKGLALATLENLNIALEPIIVSTACTSSANAIGIAFNLIATGKKKQIIVSGCDVISDLILTGLTSCNCLSNDYMKPFDSTRSGMTLGEGAATLVIEDYEYAKARHGNIYGEIIGFNTLSEHSDLMRSEEDGATISKCLNFKEEVEPNDVIVFATGNGVKKNDLSIYHGISKKYKRTMPLISDVKALYGHTLGAANIIEIITAIIGMNHNKVYPIYGCTECEYDLNFSKVILEKNYSYVIYLSTSFGGNVASLLFKRVDN